MQEQELEIYEDINTVTKEWSLQQVLFYFYFILFYLFPLNKTKKKKKKKKKIAWAHDETMLFSCGVDAVHQSKIIAWGPRNK